MIKGTKGEGEDEDLPLGKTCVYGSSGYLLSCRFYSIFIMLVFLIKITFLFK